MPKGASTSQVYRSTLSCSHSTIGQSPDLSTLKGELHNCNHQYCEEHTCCNPACTGRTACTSSGATSSYLLSSK